MWKQGGQVRGRSSALERAQAVLSSHRGRAAPAAHSAPPRAPSAQRSLELLSDLSESSLSSVPGPTHPSAGAAPGAPEVPKHETPLVSGAIRFLKRPSAAAQDQPKERAVSSSLRASQTAALSRLAQIENRFGKSVQRSPSRAGQTYVQDLTEGQVVLPSTERPSTERPSTARPSTERPSTERPSTERPSTERPSTEWPSTDRPSTERPIIERPITERPIKGRPSSLQSRRFMKSRPEGALACDTVLGRDSDPSEHSTQSNSRQLHYSVARELHDSPAIQPPSAISPSCLSPSPPTLSPSEGSACGDVRSLEELFTMEEPESDSSDSGHFRINLMDLDDLGPAALLLEERSSGKEPKLQEEVQEKPQDELPEEVQEEEVLEEVEDKDYASDFESVVLTESISEHSQDRSQPASQRSQSSYSNMFTRATTSDPSSPEALPQCDTPLPQHTSSAKAYRDPAGQTFHLPAVCGSCPSMRLLMESLRQQLALTSHFISSSQEHHAFVLQGLGPPNYRYTTLEDTLKSISTLRSSRPRSDQTERR